MSERFKEHAWKACVGETQPWVRIPLSPPSSFSPYKTHVLAVCYCRTALNGGQILRKPMYQPGLGRHLAGSADISTVGLHFRTLQPAQLVRLRSGLPLLGRPYQ